MNRKSKMTIDKITTNVYPNDEPDSDRAHRVARAALAAIPSFGGTAVELFNALITPPLERRKEQWIKEVTSALNQLLEKKLLTEEDLTTNEKFFDVLIQASTVAIKTHHREKLEALKNAITNSALDRVSNNEQNQLFIYFLDHFTVTHIRVLRSFACVHAGNSTGEQYLEKEMEDWAEHQYLYRQVWNELVSRGLITQVTDNSFGYQIYCSPLTHQFLEFISKPAESCAQASE